MNLKTVSENFDCFSPEEDWVETAAPVAALAFVAVLILPYAMKYFLGPYAGSFSCLDKVLISVIPVQLLFFLPPFIVLIWKNSKNIVRVFGFRNWKASYFKDVLKLEAMLIIPLVALALIAFMVLSSVGYTEKAPAEELLKGADRTSICVFFILSVFLAPFVEEFVFRRTIFTFTCRIFGQLPAIVVTSSIFAVMHGGMTQFLSLFLLGFVLQRLYIRNNSLYPCLMLHSLHNTIIMFIFLNIKMP